MLKLLGNDLVQCALDTFGTPFSSEDCSAINVAFLRLAQAPYFEGNHDSFVLIRRGEAFWQVHHLVYGNFEQVDPLANWYDDSYEYDDEDQPRPPAAVPHPSVYIESQRRLDPFSSDLPADVEANANRLLRAFREAYPRWRKLEKPTPEEQAARHDYRLEAFVGPSALHERLNEILGPHHALKLRAEGIVYHNPVFYGPHVDKNRYLLLHNQEEVVGLLHYLAREEDLGLAFISIAPGFRRRRVGHRLYQAFIETAQAEHKVIRRSDPGKYAEENPGITRHYDAMLRDAQVLYSNSRGYFYSVLCLAVKHYPYEDVLRLAKPICDAVTAERLERGAFAFDGGPADYSWTEHLKQTLETHLGPVQVKANPKPKIERRRRAP